MSIVRSIIVFLFFLGMGSTIDLNLPSEFHVEPTALGVDLVWSSDKVKVPMGASRSEFRLADGSVFGYPVEVDGGLRLALTSASQAKLQSQGATLQAWWGSKRVDANAPVDLPNIQMPADSSADPVLDIPTINVNPAQRGNFTARRASYTLESIKLGRIRWTPVEVIAEVTDPPDATGQRPLVLFLHGRHVTCYQGGPNGVVNLGWPCPDGWLPIPSHEGYRYVADILASQGNVVVSISANGINAQDSKSQDAGASERSTLIRHHLKLWAEWNTNGGSPWGDRFKGRVDMNQVVLVGHSRGGEGAHKAAIDALPSDPYKIVGLVTYGPTAFQRKVTPDIHSATILPTCDGDVSDLQGQAYVDASRDIAYSEALRTAVISVGTNHNFFNTEWTPGLAVAPSIDDWEYFNDPSDPVCGSNGGSVRLTAQEQQTVGAAYTAALVKLAVNQDPTMLPLLDGSNVRPVILGRAKVVTSAVGGAKNRLLYRVEDTGRPTLTNGMAGRECLGDPSYFISFGFPACVPGFYIPSPHWLAINLCPNTQALELEWTNSLGATAQFNVPSTRRNWTTLDSLDVRIAKDPNIDGVGFDLVVADESGANATLDTSFAILEGWPGDFYLNRIHARTLRGRLSSVSASVNLANIVSVFLVARNATGRVWVWDIAASEARIAVPPALNLRPRAFERCYAAGGLLGFLLGLI